MTVTWDTSTIEGQVRQAAARAVLAATEAVRTEAVRLILNTPKSGRVYRRRGIEHQASAPGEAPASDTGTLVSRIHTDYSRIGELVGVVRASAAHAPHLEYGTARIEPRPFMRPALVGVRATFRDLLQSELQGVLRRRGSGTSPSS